MSLEAMVWVLSGDAPVADVNEYAVLAAMADKADSDGCGSWLSKETISDRVHVSDETVKRCWRNMARRKLIAKGDQSLVSRYRADRRPVVYDLLIPYEWFSNIDRVNTERERLGREPLTPEDRPCIEPAPTKKRRADKGKPRPKATPERGNSETPRPVDPEPPHGGTTSRQRGNYESSTGELQDPQFSKNNQSSLSGPTGPNRDGSENARGASDESENRERAAAPEGTAAPAAAVVAGGVGEGELAGEVLVMLVGLPGGVEQAAAGRLVPLVLAAVAAGWRGPALRAYLARSCDPQRVRYAPAVYEKLLRELPAAPAGDGPRGAAAGQCPRHPAFVEGDCTRCRLEEMSRQQRGRSEPGPLDGLGLLARVRAGMAQGGAQ
ncbi:hypothetical protein [Streptomyces sp. 8L]|uniref:hypothetical protein n=1 Tax=Streptomyces sp. 8L TaxID=2877242 RepID=UPI001CD6EA8E|nr:hypothetical protein [Streptomyces sp. 8L]MCA1222189.1 hypothetical protein [Streptomyces sp. 8L]